MSKFICSNGVIVIIDLNFLKSNSIVKDAEVFKMLFGIKENNNFGDFPLEKDEDSNKTLLMSLDIESNDWYQFLSFLKYGFPPYYSQEIFHDLMKRNFFIESLEKLNITCNKFGGLSVFDKFYNDFYSTLDMSFDKNPSEPSEDVNNLYIWGFCKKSPFPDFINSLRHYPKEQGWSVTKHFSIDDDSFFWTRKKCET